MVDAVKVLAAKKEVAYGTDAAPTLAANAILTRNFRASPLITDPLERNLDRGSFGATPILATNKRQELSYEVEVAGSGAAGTAPAWMELLEACGMAAPVLSPGVSAEQRMAAANVPQSSLTQYHWMGDQRRKGLGSRGTFTMDFTAGAYGTAGSEYASDRSNAISTAEAIIAAENERIRAAQQATVDTSKAMQTQNQLTNETNDILAEMRAILRAGGGGVVMVGGGGGGNISRNVDLR